jgi:Domain of unknown function (DUF222)
VAEGLDLLEEAMDTLAGESLALDGREELMQLERVRRRLDAQISRRIAKLDSTGAYALDHHRSAAAWLKARWRCSGTFGYRAVRRARMLRRLELTALAFDAGELSTEHVDVIVNVAYPERRRAAFVEYEPTLVDIAREANVDDTELAATGWRHALDDALQRDGDSLAARQYESRNLSLIDGFNSMLFLYGSADPFDAAIIRRALDREYRNLHQAGDDRSAAQQRLDALVGICRRYLEGIPFNGSAEPHVVISVPLDVLNGEVHGSAMTQDGEPVSRRTARRVACAGSMQRLVHAAGIPLDLGRTVRTFNRQQRRALAYRDGGCRFPGCDRPPSQCEAHHIEPFAPPHEGTTDLANGILLCWHHHHFVHELGWTVTLARYANVVFHPPRGTPLISYPRCLVHGRMRIEPDPWRPARAERVNSRWKISSERFEPPKRR